MRLSILSSLCVFLLISMGCGGPTRTPSATNASPVTDQTAIVPDLTAQTTSIRFDSAVLTAQNAPTSAAPASPEATAEPGKPIRIAIEAIQLEQSVIDVGLDEKYVPIVPKHDVGWYIYSALPGQGENVVLWGHVLRFTDAPDIPAPFARLHEVAIGDTITLAISDDTEHTYVITDKIWATPDQVEYILPQGHERLTLVSCIGDQVMVNGFMDMSHRLITIGKPLPDQSSSTSR